MCVCVCVCVCPHMCMCPFSGICCLLGGGFFLFFFLVSLVLVALGLRCCAQAFSRCSEQGLLFIAVRGLLIAVASLVTEHGL